MTTIQETETSSNLNSFSISPLSVQEKSPFFSFSFSCDVFLNHWRKVLPKLVILFPSFLWWNQPSQPPSDDNTLQALCLSSKFAPPFNARWTFSKLTAFLRIQATRLFATNWSSHWSRQVNFRRAFICLEWSVRVEEEEEEIKSLMLKARKRAFPCLNRENLPARK